MLNVLSDEHIVYNLSAMLESEKIVSLAQQSAHFTACSTSRRPVAGGATKRRVGRQPSRRLETERTSERGWTMNH